MGDNFNVLDHGSVGEALVDAKGDLVTATADNTPARLAVGTDGHVLKAASGQPTGLQWAAATDTSTVPTDATTATAGTSLSASPRDHVHPRYHWAPADHGLKAWSYDGAMVSAGVTPSDGVLQLVRVHVPVASTVTNILLLVTIAGTSLTSGNNIAALYTAAGAKIDVTADQSTAWTTTGLKTMALSGGAYSAAAGDYYVAWWMNGSGTDPQFGSRGTLESINAGLSAPNLRFATANTGLTNAASAPLSLGSQTAANAAYWVALS